MVPSLQRVAAPQWVRDNAPESVFYRVEQDDLYLRRLNNAFTRIAIKPGYPESILQVENAFIMPGKPTVWSRDGHRIPEGCVRRGPGLTQYVWAGDETVAVPEDCERVDETMVYLSFMPNEWGHFLLESTSRLWAVRPGTTLSDKKCFFGFGDFRNENFAKFFRYAQFDLDRLIDFGRPVIIKNCLIPEASFSIRGEAYMRHAEVMQYAARRILYGCPSTMTSQPVYLSRSKIKRGRVIRNEPELEEKLHAAGVRIVHPQDLSFEEQVVLFNAHSHFIGCWGSAFHNLLFALKPERVTTHIMCEDVPNQNYLMIDAILRNKAHYVQTLFFSPGIEQAYPATDCFIDVDLMVEYLRGQNLI